jgi:hypothetical protein
MACPTDADRCRQMLGSASLMSFDEDVCVKD